MDELNQKIEGENLPQDTVGLFLLGNVSLFLAICCIPLLFILGMVGMVVAPGLAVIFLIVSISSFVKAVNINRKNELMGDILLAENMWRIPVFLGNILFVVNIVLFFSALISLMLAGQMHSEYLKKADITWIQISNDPSTSFGAEKDSIYREKMKEVRDEQISHVKDYLLIVGAILSLLAAIKVYIKYRSILYVVVTILIAVLVTAPFLLFANRVIIS